MLIVEKIKMLKNLVCSVVTDYLGDEVPDCVKIDLGDNGDSWTVTAQYENKPDSLILCGEGKTLEEAFNSLENRLLLLLED
jgi:hypothetical protein